MPATAQRALNRRLQAAVAAIALPRFIVEHHPHGSTTARETVCEVELSADTVAIETGDDFDAEDDDSQSVLVSLVKHGVYFQACCRLLVADEAGAVYSVDVEA